jgi:hypothetical protein
MLEARTCPSISADTTSEEEVMDFYTIMFANVSALLHSYGIKLQYVHYNRRVDEGGRVGYGRWVDDIIECLDAGDLRLIVRQSSDICHRWFSVEIGVPYEEAELTSKHCVCISFMEFSNRAMQRHLTLNWAVARSDSPEALALLQKIDPELADICSKKEGGVYRLSDSAPKDLSDKTFFFAAIDNVFRIFAEAAKSQAEATA